MNQTKKLMKQNYTKLDQTSPRIIRENKCIYKHTCHSTQGIKLTWSHNIGQIISLLSVKLDPSGEVTGRKPEQAILIAK